MVNDPNDSAHIVYIMCKCINVNIMKKNTSSVLSIKTLTTTLILFN